MRRFSIFLLILVVGLAGIYSQRTKLAAAVMTRMADKRMTEQPMAKLSDGLHVGLCGAGSPLPDDKRAAPCTVVIAGTRLFVFDSGSSSSRGITRMGFNPGAIEAIFLTHFHSDHIDGMGELMMQRWVAGTNKSPVPVYGADGVEQIVNGLRLAYTQDSTYRVAHHGEATVPSSGFGGEARPFTIVGGQFGTKVVIDEPDLQIVAFGVDHGPIHPSVGYRIRYKDRTVVISGDTSKAISVQREAKGVDLLVHEALSPRMVNLLEDSAQRAGRANLAKIFHDILNYHTSPEEVAEIARDAGVGAVLLNHIVPAVPPFPGFEAFFLGGARDIYPGKLVLGTDGDFVSLPAGGKQINFAKK